MIAASTTSGSNTNRRNANCCCGRLGLAALQIFVFVALTSYQLYQLNDLNGLNENKRDVGSSLPGGGKRAIACPDVSPRTKNMVADGASVATENSFGACLIVMDDVSYLEKNFISSYPPLSLMSCSHVSTVD